MPIPAPSITRPDQRPKTGAPEWNWRESAQGMLQRAQSMRRLGDKRKQQLYQELHMLISSGVDPATVLELLARSRREGALRDLLERARRALGEGRTLSGALQVVGGFSPYEVQTVQVGEETGRLAIVLGELAEHYAAKVKLKRMVMGAFAYPGFVLFVTAAVVAFMLRVVVPMFSEVFSRSGAELPAITLFVVKLSKWSGPALLMLFFMTGTAVLSYALLRNKPWVQRPTAWTSVRLPLVGPIHRLSQFARCYRALGSMLAAQLPLDRALELCDQLVDLHSLRTALQDVRLRVLKGSSLHEACAGHPIFDPKDVAMIAVAEEVRQLDTMFLRLADQHSAEVQHRSSMLGSVLEPFMIVFIAIFVGLILIAMYLPMFKLSTAF